MARARKARSGKARSNLFIGAVAAAVIIVLSAWGFTRYNPLHSPFEMTATFNSANNLATGSPVRVAGVDVGLVKKVEPVRGGSGAAKVTMEIEDKGLPIHKDAELKIRPRIFLEGNFFVDVNPGTASAPNLEDGGEIPIQQTATPVQFGQLLTALQADTRTDLQILLHEFGERGLGNGGAEAYNRSLRYQPEALRNAAIANEATLGERPHDLSRLLRGQQRLSRALTFNPEKLKDLVTNLNVTFRAFAREDDALEAAMPALRDTLRAGIPALSSLNASLPSLRAFAREALPGTISSLPTLRESRPFIRQARLLVRRQELRGLVRDLRPTIPALARLNRDTIPFLDQNRALSACTSKMLVPFATKPIPNPDEPGNTNQTFIKQSNRAFTALSSESRIMDANSPFFHVNFGTGPTTVFYRSSGDSTFFAQAPSPPVGVRPDKPNNRPPFRPGIPCEKQELPDLNAVGGPPDESLTFGPIEGLPGLPTLPALPKPTDPKLRYLRKAGDIQVNQILDMEARRRKGLPALDVMGMERDDFARELRKLGLASTPKGHIVERKDYAAAVAKERGESGKPREAPAK